MDLIPLLSSREKRRCMRICVLLASHLCYLPYFFVAVRHPTQKIRKGGKKKVVVFVDDTVLSFSSTSKGQNAARPVQHVASPSQREFALEGEVVRKVAFVERKVSATLSSTCNTSLSTDGTRPLFFHCRCGWGGERASRIGIHSLRGGDARQVLRERLRAGCLCSTLIAPTSSSRRCFANGCIIENQQGERPADPHADGQRAPQIDTKKMQRRHGFFFS